MDILLHPTEFEELPARQWVRERRRTVFVVCALYVLVVFGLRRLMRDRQPLKLDVPLRLWNLALAIFSILGAVSISPEFFHTVRNYGFVDSYCHARDCFKGYNGYWIWLFYVSKVVELGDTLFLVLRKRPLMFLHWYHHFLTTTYAFVAYPEAQAIHRWGSWMNYVVHSFMYSYYFLRSSGVHVPRGIAQMVTAGQIVQFIVSCTILIHLGYAVLVQGLVCDLNTGIYWFAMCMSASYLVLFTNFFINAYCRGKKKSQ